MSNKNSDTERLSADLMIEVGLEGWMSVEPGGVDSWDSIIGHKTLQHEGRKQISRRPTIWFGVKEARRGLSYLCHIMRERETTSLKCLFAEALLL